MNEILSAKESHNKKIKSNSSNFAFKFPEIRSNLAPLQSHDEKMHDSFAWAKELMLLIELRYKESKQEFVTVKSDIGVIKKQIETIKGDIEIIKDQMGSINGNIEIMKKQMGVMKDQIEIMKKDMNTNFTLIFNLLTKMKNANKQKLNLA